MSAVKVWNETTQRWDTVASGDATGIRTTNSNLKKSDNLDEAITELSKRVTNLKNNVAWIYKNGTIGGGGGGGETPAKGTIITSITESPHYISTTDNLIVSYMVESRFASNFYVTLRLNQQTSINVTVRPNQWYTWEVGRLPSGNHTLFISGVDSDQMPINFVTITVISGALEITSTFNDSTIFNVSSDINIPYTVSSYLTTPINVESSINLTPQPTIVDVPVNRLMQYNLGQRPIGVYNVEMQALSSGYTSNKLEFTINVASTDQLFLSVANNIQRTFARGIPIKFAYTIAVLGYTAFQTHYEISGKTGTLNSRLGTNVFEIPSDDLSPGTHILRLTANDADNVISTTEPLEIEITITATDFTPWEPNPSGLIAHFKARGINHSQTEFWTNSVPGSNITCSLTGINGSSNGFIGDSDLDSIDKSLVLNGEAYGVINYQPFTSEKQVLTNGLTISVLYKTTNIGNKKARVLDCARYNPDPSVDVFQTGLYVDTEDAEISTARRSVNAKIAENEWVNQTFVIDQKFLKIYNNGVITAVINHDGASDDISHIGNIYLGTRGVQRVINGVNTLVLTDFADCSIKDVKVYNRALTSEEVVYNYVGDEYYLHTVNLGGSLQFDEERQKALRRLNSMTDDGDFIIDTTATSPFPILEIKFTDNDIAAEFREYSERTIWSSNADVFRQFPCIINYSDYQNDRYLTNHNGYISLQGTSSVGYTSKNYEIYLGKMNDGLTDFLFTPKNDWLPENRFTLKCNMMDSSHANNVGTGRLLNDNWFRDPVPPKIDPNNNNRDKIKDAVDGFPSLLQIAMGRTDENGNEDNYMGVYTFNMGRGSFYNLGLKNADFEILNGVAVSYTDKPTGLYSPNNAFAYEISTSNNNGAGAFKQQSAEWISSEFNRIYPPNDSVEGFRQLSNVVQKTSDSGPPVEVTDLEGNPILDPNGNPVMTPGGLDFRDQTVWNRPSLADYLILCYTLGMVDNLGKNLLMKTWQKDNVQESIWYTTFYDMDTILGLNNVGTIAHGPDVDIDSYPTGNFVVDQNNPANRGNGDYNLSGSRLWELYRQHYYGFETSPENEPTSFNLLQRYTNLRRNGTLSYDNLVGKYMSVIESIGQNYYNKDAEIKYMNEFANANGDIGYHNLSFLHGTREHYTKLWLKRRITYLDSIFDASNNLMPGNTSAKGLNFRFNTGTAASVNRVIDVRSLSPVFITALWRGEDDRTEFSKLLVTAEDFTRFERSFSANEQATNLNFGPEIMYLENLNSGNPSYLNLSNATNLIRLDLSGNTYLQAINLDGCVSLRHLDLRNCTRLGEGASQDPRRYIDVSKCVNLQTLDVSNTKLVQVSLPQGGTLKTLRCNDTLITNLDLSNQSFLEEVDLSNCRNLTTINLANCANLKRIILTNTALASFLASNCPQLEVVDLSNSGYLTSINFNLTPNMKELKLNYCNNTGLNELNLIGCPILEDLEMTACTATLLRFQNTFTTLKRLIASNSSIEATRFGGVNDDDNDKWGIYPALNFQQLVNLTTISFTNCKNLRAITNINLTLTNGGNIFANCTNLLRLTGNLKLNGSASQMFYFCENFKLYDSQMSGGNVVLPADTGNFPLNLDVSGLTSASQMFTNCTQLDIGHVYYFFRRAINLTSATSAFGFCTGLVTNTARPFPEAIFERSTKITSLSQTFDLCTNLSGPFPQTTLWPLVNLTNAYRAFRGCKFTFIDQSAFIENVRLSNAEDMFRTNSIANTVFGKNLLFRNVALTNTSGMFYGNSNFNVVLETDTLFRFNDKLTNISDMFYSCNVSGQIHPNMFGGVTPTATGEENGETVTYRWPTRLVNLGNAFYGNANIVGEFDNALFANLTLAQYLNGVFGNTGISGDIPIDLFRNNTELLSIQSFFMGTGITGNIPPTLLHNNTKLVNAANLFTNCIELTSEIPTELFRYTPSLTQVANLFSGCEKIRGTVPNDLFRALDSNNLEVPLPIQDASALFNGCFSLIGPIPEGLFRFTPNIRSLANLFNDCGTINRNNQFGIDGSIPEGLLFGLFNLTNVSGMFYRCNKLQATIIPPENPIDPDIVHKIPKDFFRDNSAITSIRSTFSYLSMPGQIPLGLFDPLRNLTDASYAFYSSSFGNISLDRDLFKFNNRLQNISFMFSNDSATGSSNWTGTLYPELFTRYTSSPTVSGHPLRNVASAFAKNTALGGNSVKFWEFGTITSNSNCYYNCTQLTDYSTIPNNYK